LKPYKKADPASHPDLSVSAIANDRKLWKELRGMNSSKTVLFQHTIICSSLN